MFNRRQQALVPPWTSVVVGPASSATAALLADDGRVDVPQSVRISASPDGFLSGAEPSAEEAVPECLGSGPEGELCRKDQTAVAAPEPVVSPCSSGTLSTALVSPPTAAALQLWLPEESRQARKARRWGPHKRRAGRRPADPQVGSVERPLASWEPVAVSEARGYATRFAADYLSWDELEPTRRAAALRTYLADPSMADVGWSGRGRQRADLVTTGHTVVLGEGRIVVVEVTARVVGYHRNNPGGDQFCRAPAGEVTPPLAFAPASAPSPVVTGWEPGAAWWVRIAPPVRRDHDGRLVVDLGLDLSRQS